jgi:hypothetical protein
MHDSYEVGSHFQLAEELEASGELQDGERLQLFSCACCRLIINKLPSVAQEALTLGEDFSKGLVLPNRLEAERVKLWKVLDKDSCRFDLPHVNAIRAVICCLFERKDPEFAYENVRAVMEFCNAVEDHEREQYDLLERVFVGPKVEEWI